MLKCSYCGKENSVEAESCSGCGTPLVVKHAAGAVESAEWSPADRRMLRGAAWCAGGILVTLVTYSAAAPGGTYVIAWGAIAWGAVEFFQGLSGRSSRAARQVQARDQLDLAAHLESVDRTAAISKYQEIVQSFPRTPAAREAERNLRTLTAQQPASPAEH